MHQSPNNGVGYGSGDRGKGWGESYDSASYPMRSQDGAPYPGGVGPSGSAGQRNLNGPPANAGGYRPQSSGGAESPAQGHGFGSVHGSSGYHSGPHGAYPVAAPVPTSSVGGSSGLSPRLLGIIGGGLALVLVLLLVLVFVVFADSEGRDRKNVIKAAERLVNTLASGQSFSELNQQLCSRHQAGEREVEEIDGEMSAMGYDLPELFYLDDNDLADLRSLTFTERDVEFTSDSRREADVYFDVFGDELTFRNVDGRWVACDADFDMSNADVDYFSR